MKPALESVLQYVSVHQGCSSIEVGIDLGIGRDRAHYQLQILYAKGYLGRQVGLTHVVPTRYWIEDRGLAILQAGVSA